jgi:hypothetical protein
VDKELHNGVLLGKSEEKDQLNVLGQYKNGL